MPLNPLQAIQKIEKTLITNNRPVSISRLAKKTGMHYTTVKRYVSLLEFVKKMPEIEMIKGEGTILVRVEKNFSQLSTKERKKLIKSYFPELSIEEKILLELLSKRAISETTAMKKKTKAKVVKLLLKADMLKETKDSKVYLSEFGQRVARGAKSIYIDG